MSLLPNVNNSRKIPILQSSMEMFNSSMVDVTTRDNSISFITAENENPGDAKYFGILVGFVVLLFGTVGNGLTVWAYVHNKNLQTSFNILIANLCLIELLFSIIVIPIILPGYIAGYNVYTNGFCAAVGYFYYASIASSLYNLVAIAVNRFVGIVQPEKYQKLFTGQRLKLCIASIWLVPPILYLPLVIGNGIRWRENTLRCAIGESHDVSQAIRLYNLALNITFQAIPLLILIILYTAIFHKVKQVKEKMKEHRKSSRRSARSARNNSTGSRSSVTRNRSGTTSDDTGDDFKPPSLIEGFGLKPAPNSFEKQDSRVPATPQKNSENAEDNEYNPLNDNHNDNESIATGSYQSEDEENPERAVPIRKKRNSIWNILIRNSIKANTKDVPHSMNFIDSPMPSISTDHHSSDETTSQKSPVPQRALKKGEAKLRENDIEMKNLRRKRSLSAPNLPLLDFTNPNVAKIGNAQNAKEYLQVLPPGVSNQSDNETKMSRTRSAYVKKKPRDRAQSDTDPQKSKTSWSVRIKRSTKEWASNLSLQGDSDNEGQQGHRPRLGTIARKVQEKRLQAERRDEKSRYQRRLLRKRQARERQLVYSSFAICIAFAVCITPTSLLYIIQLLFDVRASATAVIIVSCIAWIHAVLNPVIYGYLNSQYRREYNKMVAALKRKLFKSDTTIPKSQC